MPNHSEDQRHLQSSTDLNGSKEPIAYYWTLSTKNCVNNISFLLLLLFFHFKGIDGRIPIVSLDILKAVCIMCDCVICFEIHK